MGRLSMTRSLVLPVCLLLLLFVGCTPAAEPTAPTPSSPPATVAPTATPVPTPVSTATASQLFQDFLAQHSQVSRQLGASRGALIWLDGQPAQLFERGLLSVDASGVFSDTIETLPAEVTTLKPASWHATLSAPPIVEPLLPFTVTLSVPGYTGPAELRLYDQQLRPAGVWPAEIRDGAAIITVEGRGALGHQSGLLLIDGELAGVARRLFELDAQTTVQTGQPRFDTLYPQIKAFMEQDVTAYELDGYAVRGYRSPDNNLLWLRDHTYQARAFRYFETDMTSLIDAFRRAQRPDGSFPDYLARPEHQIDYKRLEVEADVEYLFVQAVYEAWQATGDDAWLKQNLEAMRRALAYTMSDPLRWDAERQLVKRPYTIDTWDFEYGPTTRDPTTGQPAPRHWIDERTIWGIFHGDNTGLAFALRLMERIEQRVGDRERAKQYRAASDGVMERLNALSWNGNFYTHFVPLEPFDVPGVDESRQLSLSNAYALNRMVLKRQQNRAIIEEYYRRGQERGDTFAEWYSIDPPFPAGSYGMAGRLGENPGEYVNGGIMPLVGGELARGAFRYGTERYAFETLARYAELLSLTGESYLWYYPAGNPGKSSDDTLPTDGWGSSAMLGALIEGAAGIVDQASRYRAISLSPRWSATDDVNEARVVARYAASDGYVAYRWQRKPNQLRLEFTSTSEQTELRLLLPAGVKRAAEVTLDGVPQEYGIEDIYGSRYVELEVAQGSGTLLVRWE
jgi:hypothetical protein